MLNSKTKVGYVITFLSYLIWGIMTIYWKQINHFESLEILGARILFSALTLFIVVHCMKKPIYLTYLKEKKSRNKLVLSSVMIAINWGIFLLAVGTGNVLQASLGYFINPLVSTLLGVIFLHEKMSKVQLISIVFAATGVVYMTFFYGVFPWISLILAFSFGLYGLLKKKAHLDSLNSLLVEVIFLVPFAIGLLIVQGALMETSVFESSIIEWVLIVFSGVVTILPLSLFAEGVKRIPLSAVGFLQYIVPTMMFFIGVFMYNESFSYEQGISFGLIWIGVLVYLASIRYKSNQV